MSNPTIERATAVEKSLGELKPVKKRRGPAPGTPNVVAERKRKEQEAQRKRYEEQEAKRATLIQADTSGMQILNAVLAGLIIATSFTVSYFTLVDVASWMRLSEDWLRYAVPFFIEVVIFFGATDFVTTGSRNGKTWVPLAMMIGATLIAVVGNGAHTVSEWLAEGEIPWEGFIGIGLAAVVPLMVVYATKRITVLVFSKAIVLEER